MSFYTEVIESSADFHSLSRIAIPNLLEPTTRAAVLAMAHEAEAQGLPVVVFETYRSQERQQALFDQHVSQLKTVGVHHYGLACDIVRVVNGQPNWNVDYSFLGTLAKKHGLIWGGDWGSPGTHHSFIDADHVQRCAVADQQQLFSGAWYPDAAYDPYHPVNRARDFEREQDEMCEAGEDMLEPSDGAVSSRTGHCGCSLTKGS